MPFDIMFLNLCLTTMRADMDIHLMMHLHEQLKSYTPVGLNELECDIMWLKAWRTCPPNEIGYPSREIIRDCDIRFCESLLDTLRFRIGR